MKTVYHKFWNKGPTCALIANTTSAEPNPSQLPQRYTDSTRPNPKMAKNP